MAVPMVTALYAGILALIGVVLGAGSGFKRLKTGVSMGGGGAEDDQLQAFRRHGNFAEWVPLTLLVIALLELNGVGSTAIHALAGTLVVARILHPLGLGEDTSNKLRGAGAGLTVLVTVISAVWAILRFV